MPLVTFKDLCMDVNDVAVARDFWAPTLGLTVKDLGPGDPDGISLVGPYPQHTIWPCVVPEPHTVKNRVHLDVVASSLEPFEHLQRLSEPGEFPWTVYADPEGNEFCVFVVDDPGELRLKDVVVDAADPHAIATWWQEVWGGDLGSEPEKEWFWLDDIPGAPVESFDFVPVPEPKTVKNRVHWDVTLADGTVDDLVAAGATVLREPDGEIRWTVMADPEGNEFCVFAPEDV